MVDVLLITGMSGAGRTQAGNTLEDLGWFVIDNMPVELMPRVAELGRVSEGSRGLALVAGAEAEPGEVRETIEDLRASGMHVASLFLDASTSVLVRRYGETRRRHPMLARAGSTEAAIERERELLEPVRQAADVVVDTTELTIHDLRRRIIEQFGRSEDAGTQVTLLSFGFKHGVPPDIDMLFDCRFLPNPHWDPELRPLTGLDERVQGFVTADPAAEGFTERVQDLLRFLVPAFEADGKSVLTIAFGCTGGHHRSVTMAERFGEWLRSEGRSPQIRHRDIER